MDSSAKVEEARNHLAREVYKLGTGNTEKLLKAIESYVEAVVLDALEKNSKGG